jgi:predicted small lipoprotein YifL
MLRQFLLAAVLVAALTSASCGIKGPLVLPPKTPPTAAAPATPATGTPPTPAATTSTQTERKP